MAQLDELHVVVDYPVMAPGEERNRAHRGTLQSIHEPLRVELTADAGDLL
jgi:hypothetical protein